MSDRTQMTHDTIQAFQHVVHKLRRGIQQQLEENWGVADFVFLHQLHTQGPSKGSDLSSELNVTNSHVTQHVNRMVKKGWISRHRSTDDKRIVELAITPAGTEVYNEMVKRRFQYFQQLFHTLSDEELDSLLHLLQKLID
ncbi:MarR family winged helix-turn-helix transcriptional regulator [Marininema halotolerans]|uniref:DNA-binding transcriptional regulator, MarR family n=1 Tax=Marininema halotolerans TaxID=1155944 RepID=A0A1I6S5X6_9BACL|nr:MarR family transcriptional regulator [Marininema halotolerans]SFS72341.1 DNA-binding transcriptional regulator, MarR family [Marininema halotolerans]